MNRKRKVEEEVMEVEKEEKLLEHLEKKAG